VRYTLKDYQVAATNDVVKVLRRAGHSYAEDATDHWSVALSAPTGAGKTVIASAVIETLFDGAGSFPEDPLATVLWVTDDPALNEQTKRKMLQASSTLSPARLVTIDAGFDKEAFETRRVYFLNIQKLARTNPLARSNAERRMYSLWQTIANTVRDNGAHFYVVIDEAHKGMKSEGDRATIVSRIINGQEGLNPPAPIVWGISATPERFVQAIKRWDVERTSRPVTVPLDDVRASGLLKDKIVLDNPADSQHEGDTTLARAAVAQTRLFETAWQTYATSQGEPAVLPVLVVQVQNTPSDAELTELMAPIFGAWNGLQDENVVNTFGEHTALSVGGHTIKYMLPQEIQDDPDVRVVLCKDAISTGWDCPRAEVLVSLRRAVDYTYIAQLIGRMVRTPLARRIPSDQTLNDVHCYLPRFNKQQVQDIVDRFAQGNNDEPPVETITNPVRVWRNEQVPESLFAMLEALPSYVVPGRIYRTQVSRLHTLATLLSGDHIVEDALAQSASTSPASWTPNGRGSRRTEPSSARSGRSAASRSSALTHCWLRSPLRTSPRRRRTRWSSTTTTWMISTESPVGSSPRASLRRTGTTRSIARARTITTPPRRRPSSRRWRCTPTWSTRSRPPPSNWCARGCDSTSGRSVHSRMPRRSTTSPSSVRLATQSSPTSWPQGRKLYLTARSAGSATCSQRRTAVTLAGSRRTVGRSSCSGPSSATPTSLAGTATPQADRTLSASPGKAPSGTEPCTRTSSSSIRPTMACARPLSTRTATTWQMPPESSAAYRPTRTPTGTSTVGLTRS